MHPGVGSLPDMPWSLQRHSEVGRGHFLPRFPHGCCSGIGPGLALACPPSVGQPVPVHLVQRGLGPSHDQKSLCFSPQSPKGFLESYEEMLSYALRPETWATTRLELEGRGVGWLVLRPGILGSLIAEILDQEGGACTELCLDSGL